MTRRLRGAAFAVLLVGGGCTAPSSGSSPAEGHGAHADAPTELRSVEDAQWLAVDDDDALFTVDCPFSHRASDDPIVHPGEPGASHSHEFFGSRATDDTSTGESLRGTATTCEDTEDTAAYWVPTLSVDDAAVAPTFVRAYYRARAGVDVREVTAPPLGLAMIAAITDEAGHHGGSGGEGGWGCGLRPRRLRAEPPTDCVLRSPLTLQLRFPDCWDGERLDTPDHAAHVARSVDGACPSSHPVVMTELQLSVSWPVIGPDAGRAVLSSGPTAEAHGDFLNGWEPDALARHVDLCIHAKANCTIG